MGVVAFAVGKLEAVVVEVNDKAGNLSLVVLVGVSVVIVVAMEVFVSVFWLCSMHTWVALFCGGLWLQEFVMLSMPVLDTSVRKIINFWIMNTLLILSDCNWE